MKDKAIITFIFFFVCFVGFKFASLYYKEKKERQRITLSFQASEQKLAYYRTQNGQLAAKNQVLMLQYRELGQIFPKVVDEIRKLDIKPRHVTQYSETVVKQEKEVVTRLRDSLVRDTIHARVFNYQDRFYFVKGIAIGDTQKVHITSLDSLVQVVYKGKRVHPWLWFFSARKLEQVIASKNPNSTIVYNKTIQVTKK
jgi:hypothetical protein